MKIKVRHNVTEEQLAEMDVRRWPVWNKKASTFPWYYERQERCYFLEGQVLVTPDSGEPVTMGKGDFVTFPQGMSCKWEIREDVRKHYTFD